MSDASEDATELDLAAAEEAQWRDAFVLVLDLFDGPLHLLLELARARKIDIARLSVGR
jgi:segregation and condensation protein A